MAGGAHDPLQIIGLKELRRELKQIDKGLPKQLKETNKRIAETVEIRAKGRGRSLGGVYAKASRSLRAGSTGTRAFVSLGGARYPFAKGAEFGSVRYLQFGEWRGNGEGAGYFLYPTIRAEKHNIRKVAEEEIGDLIESLGR